MIELTIQVKNTDTSMTDKFLEYDELTFSRDDPKLRSLVEITKQRFLKATASEDGDLDIWVRTKMMW